MANDLSAKDAASLLGIGAERVRQLAKDGWIEKAGHGKYPLVSLVQGYIAFLKSEERRTSKSATATRWQELRIEEKALALAQQKKELMPVTHFLDAVDVICGTVIGEINSIAPRVTRDMDLRKKIDDEARAALNRISESVQRTSEIATEGGDVTKDNR